MSRPSVEVLLKELKLSGIRENLEDVLSTASENRYAYKEFLGELLIREQETRRNNRTQRLLTKSRLPLHKKLSEFNESNLSLKLRQQIQVLKEGHFVDRNENVLAFGPPGTGKTHLLCGLAQSLILCGRSAYFIPCNLLVQDLLRAKQNLELEKSLKKLQNYDMILLDDIGYVKQSQEEMEVLFTLIAACYERTSLLITSNLPFSKWEIIFKDPMTTAAAIDRLVHHSVILEMNNQSYRMKEAKSRRKSA